jgi:hypothetical protein
MKEDAVEVIDALRLGFEGPISGEVAGVTVKEEEVNS